MASRSLGTSAWVSKPHMDGASSAQRKANSYYDTSMRSMLIGAIFLATACLWAGCAKQRPSPPPAPAIPPASTKPTATAPATQAQTAAARPTPGDGGLDALMRACSTNQPQVARALIDSGVDVRAATSAGWTPLMSAARGGCVECIAM